MLPQQISKPWYQIPATQVLEQLNSTESGLSDSEADKRVEQYGYNKIRSEKEKSGFLILLSQFNNLIVYLLIGAMGISYAFGDFVEATAILAVILINAIIGFIIERQAIKSMSALKRLDKVFARVRRNEEDKKVNAEALVPGDVILLESGDLVPADVRIIKGTQLAIDESPLTGESFPVSKETRALRGDTPLAERRNMLFKGTSVTSGNGVAVVVATGMNTELGSISEMVQSAGKDELPLNVKLESFSRKLIWPTLAIILPFLIVGLFENRDLYLMAETAIALAVAAIPEGLPIVATIALARGMLKLARKKVIVKKLAAVETLGEANVILTDKTGTITENKLTVHKIHLPDMVLQVEIDDKNHSVHFDPRLSSKEGERQLKDILRISTLCNNASFKIDAENVGDPLEIALLRFATFYNKDLPKHLLEMADKIDEEPFTSDKKVMGTVSHIEGEYYTAVKGATENLLSLCSLIEVEGKIEPLTGQDKKKWLKITDELAADGLKVLAFAFRQDKEKPESFMSDLVFTGLVGFVDPPREDVTEAIKECHEAGIKVVMVTGDHPSTAKNIAARVGLISADDHLVMHGKALTDEDLSDPEKAKEIDKTLVFSRVTPQQKLKLVEWYKKQGSIVGMTGDGVNDAPALKAASIGIAMGIRGTQVSQQAADLVLKDDAFSSIVKAIRQGRIIFNNIRNFIIYLLSCNLSEVMVVSIAAFANLALPLLPLQILFLNIVTDVFPALALGMGEGNPQIMKKPPRDPQKPILSKNNWIVIVVYSAVLTISVFSVFLYGLNFEEYTDDICNNIAFYSLAFAQLVHPLNLISRKTPFFNNDIIKNPHLWAAVIFCSILLVLVGWFPFTQEVLSLQNLGTDHLLLIAVGSLMPLVIIQILKRLRILW